MEKSPTPYKGIEINENVPESNFFPEYVLRLFAIPTAFYS